MSNLRRMGTIGSPPSAGAGRVGTTSACITEGRDRIRATRTIAHATGAIRGCAVSLAIALAAILTASRTQATAAASEANSVAAPGAASAAPAATASGIVRLTKDQDLWIDPQRKLVIVDGQVCLREGQLEMFACPRGSKEHESIVSVNCKAQFIHAALLAVGARPGTPVSFVPVYRPAHGPIVDVYVLWEDTAGKRHRVRAQEWIKELKTGQAMSYSWVFAGSGFWTDETTGQRYYQADGGDLICVANFPTATLDLPVASSQSNEGLLFVAWTERIPPLGAKVRLVLAPRLADKKTADKAATKADGPPPTDPSR